MFHIQLETEHQYSCLNKKAVDILLLKSKLCANSTFHAGQHPLVKYFLSVHLRVVYSMKFSGPFY